MGAGRRLRTTLAAVPLFVVVLATACAADPPGAIVAVRSTGCPPSTANGTGFVIGDGLVLVSAHVVKGSDEVAITRGRHATTGEVIAFDPEMDLAVVRTDTGSTPLLPQAALDEDAAPGTQATAYVVRDGKVRVLPVTIRRFITLHTEDIYVEGDTYRPGYELDANIQPGDSGGPVVVNGQVVGVLWAKSSRFEGRAYAVDPVRASEAINQQLREGIDENVDIERCY